MAEPRNDGGPAFPVELERDGRGLQTGSYTGWATGMTLRDYFAAQAMQQGMAVITGLKQNVNDYQIGELARIAYLAADAMIKAREP